MRCYTTQECDEWLSRRERQRPDQVEAFGERLSYPPEYYRIYYLARWIATELTYDQPALLQITEWDLWTSSENWHLYYRTRNSYGEYRLLEEVPGHLFLKHEKEDLASFLQLAMLNGWGGYVLTQADYVNMYFKNDGYVDFFAAHDSNLGEVRKQFSPPNWTRKPL
jgi:hypothetical protein